MGTHKQNIKYFLYPPGLISLVLLPILCIWQLNKVPIPAKEKAMQIILWDKDVRYPELLKFKKPIPKRKNFVINISGVSIEDEINLRIGRLAIRKLLLSNDTVHGVDFHFTSSAKYWALVRAFDLCRIEKAKTYWYINDDILVFNEVPLTKIEQRDLDSAYAKIPKLFCGNASPGFYDNLIQIKSKEQIEQEKQASLDFILYCVKAFCLSEILFIVLIILSVLKSIKLFSR